MAVDNRKIAVCYDLSPILVIYLEEITKIEVNRMNLFEKIDANIQDGYDLISENNCQGGCDKWLDAWDDIKALFEDGAARDIYELDKQYEWTQYIRNYAQDLELELHNAGLKDKAYHKKRAVYCEELLKWCGKNERITSSTKRGMAEGYYEFGDTAIGEQLFQKWLRDDPDWGWGYIGWSDFYASDFFGSKQHEKAEEILLTGFARAELRDRIDVVDHLICLYMDMGKPDKVEEYEKILSGLLPPVPVGSPFSRLGSNNQ